MKWLNISPNTEQPEEHIERLWINLLKLEELNRKMKNILKEVIHERPRIDAVHTKRA